MTLRLGLVGTCFGSLLISIGIGSGSGMSSPRQTRGPTVRTSKTGKATVLYAESHALIVGMADYSNGWEDLPGVLSDMRAVRDALEQHGFQVQELLNATRQRFDLAIRGFVGQCGQNTDNRLVIYFAGHGATITSNDGKNRRTGYLVSVDAPVLTDGDAGEFKKLAIGMNEINTYAREINSKHALFIFDSCFSGVLFKMRGGLPDYVSDKLAEPVRQFITAGSDKQGVPDKSVFQRQLVAALQGQADADCDGFVTGTELGEFLHRTVSDYTKRRQTPQHGKINDPDLDRGDIVFSVPTSPSRCREQSPPQKMAAVRESPFNETQNTVESSKGWNRVEDRTLIVEAVYPWTSTSILIEEGQLVRANVSGGNVNLGALGFGGADGVSRPDSKRPVGDCRTGALVAKIASQMVCVQSGVEFLAGTSGELMIGINESRTTDNAGSFVVRIRTFRKE